jgi:hypothetical protein
MAFPGLGGEIIMATFKVVLDGIDLSDEQSSSLARSIQQAAILALADMGTGPQQHLGVDPTVIRPSSPSFTVSMLTGPGTKGLVAVNDPANLATVVNTEFEAPE